ncbi:MAG: heavy metal-responsive transcriptional regulator [Chloroflexi bacterium]|uniref:heavy metal-responsive transcriptional regulator n=1 Tax=Candidatus Flexifilum breve TaxID=3140694 RepID=UPI0031372533|nr:heavy metal-responsive transcriptional regulator [Chloroflexota bacterium]
MSDLTRGELAKQSGVNRETIRYYERNGLLPTPDRTEANYCLFAPKTVQRVRFIKRAQAVGFSLTEIKVLLDLKFSKEATCGSVRNVVRGKIAEIDEKIAALTAMRDVLVTLNEDCPGGEHPISECPILESFSEAQDMERAFAALEQE